MPTWFCRRAVALAATVGVVAAGCDKPSTQPGKVAPVKTVPAQPLIKVATWNIRSGMGIAGFATKNWSSATLNCSDPSQPMNAWGMGLPQLELEKLRSDSEIVALALQEAWNCGNPKNVNGVLGFKGASHEYDGTALLARYGFSGAVQHTQLSRTAWLVGADVCLDPLCGSTLPMVAAHWDSVPSQAQQTIDVMAARRVPQLFMGDLNVYQIDQWNPQVPCTGEQHATHLAAIQLVENAGFTDAWKSTQSGEGWTGMATRNGCGVPNGNLFKRIDYVYAKGLRVVSTTRFARTEPGSDSPSDHVGLIAELAVAK